MPLRLPELSTGHLARTLYIFMTFGGERVASLSFLREAKMV